VLERFCSGSLGAGIMSYLGAFEKSVLQVLPACSDSQPVLRLLSD
jgi:hypothetical protein